MKTAVLFSALSYLIGLTIGTALESVKSALTAVKPVTITNEPVKERVEKSYPFEGDKPAVIEQSTPTTESAAEKL